MTEKIKKIYFISAVITLILSIVSFVCLYRSVILYFDGTIQHFTSGTALPAIAFSLSALAAVSAIVCAVIARIKLGKVHRIETLPSKHDMFFRLFSAAVFFILFVSDLLSFSSVQASLLSASSAFLAFASAVALAVQTFSKKGSSTASLFSIFPILWSVVSMLKVYFSSELALNSPLKSAALMAYIYMIIFFIGEARFFNNKQNAPFYVFISLISLSLISIALPILILVFKGENYFSLSRVASIVPTAVWMLSLSRVVGSLTGKVTEESHTPEQITNQSECGEDDT